MSNIPRQCATCQHYDNWNGVCRKFNATTFYGSSCKYFEICEELKKEYESNTNEH